MVFNLFSINEYYNNEIKNGQVLVDIDFYRKDNESSLVPYGHYHGWVNENQGAGNITMRFPVLIYKILKNSLENVGKVSNFERNKEFTYLDSTYVPQKGIYLNLLDYKYNAPYQTKQAYSIEKVDENLIKYKTKSDSLYEKIIGYSDGKDFYFIDYKILNNKFYLSKTPTKGRYLFLDLESPEKNNNQVYLLNTGGFIGGLIATAVVEVTKEIEKRNRPKINANLIDIENCQIIPFNDNSFWDFFPKDDELKNKLEKYPTKSNAIEFTKRVNQICHLNSKNDSKR